jgi:DNA-binding CsgD family transcriptional regulator/tetratricopeptide (TPR) repeat protein
MAAALPVPDLFESLRERVGDVDQRHMIVDAIENAFERAAMLRPIALVLEDTHWADPGTVLALHRLVRRDDLPSFVLVTCRPVPRPPELQRVIDTMLDAGGSRLTLGPLGADEVNELVRSTLGEPPGPALAGLLQRAAGNPLFVLELLQGLLAERQIEISDGVAETGVDVAPPSLRALILRRLGFLSGEVIALLRSAAVLGESMSAADLAVVAGRSLSDVLSLLEQPLAAGFLTAGSEGFAFRHDLVREALYLDIPPALRKAMHLHAARVLAAAGAERVRVAEHAALGADEGDRQAVEWLRDAAETVAVRDPVAAARLFRRAAELLPRDDADRHALLLSAVHELTLAGRIHEATELADQMAPDVANGPLEILLAIERLNLLVLQLRIDDMAAYVEELLEKPFIPEEFHVQLRALIVGGRAFLQDPQALHDIESFRPWAEANPETAAAGTIFLLDGYDAWSQGRFTAAVAHFDRAVGGMSTRGRAGQTLGLAAAARMLADDFPGALATFQQSRRALEQRGMVQYLVEDYWLYASMLFATGRWDDALAEIEASRELAAETGAVGTASVMPDPSPLILAFRGKPAEAAAALDRISAQPELSTGVFTNWTAPIRAAVHDFAGNRAAAIDTLRSWRAAVDELHLVPDYRSTARTLVRIAAEDSELRQALKRGAHLALAAGPEVASARAAALLVEGSLTNDVDKVTAAVEAARAGGRPFEIGEACAQAGVMKLRNSETAGIELIDEALQQYEDLGAEACATRLLRELRDLGIRRATRTSRPRSGWDALTPTERQVVGLVTSGLTNAEIGQRLYVSKGTVATHLRHVFRKLNVTSRAQLAAQAVRRLGTHPNPNPNR